ncbi:MAG: hypothetical protein OXI96_10925 [Acidimicrobiaceae bacterium]|nr:hypothetical protein [Acidimicrobiaceae bacterium]
MNNDIANIKLSLSDVPCQVIAMDSTNADLAEPIGAQTARDALFALVDVDLN